MTSRLERFVDAARERLEERRHEVPLSQLEKQAASRGAGRPFSEALAHPGTSVIAEHKRHSPSSGPLGRGQSVTEVVQAYERGGAAALSIITEQDHWHGALADLVEAYQASQLPILCKDFIIDRHQLYEAKAAGADAVLLVVGALQERDLALLHEEAVALDLDPLVEVRTEAQLNIALGIDAEVIGINNRDLETLTVDRDTTRELLAEIPAGKTVVSESGIGSRQDVDELEGVGVDAVLIGEVLMGADDPEEMTRGLSLRDSIDGETPA